MERKCDNCGANIGKTGVMIVPPNYKLLLESLDGIKFICLKCAERKGE